MKISYQVWSEVNPNNLGGLGKLPGVVAYRIDSPDFEKDANQVCSSGGIQVKFRRHAWDLAGVEEPYTLVRLKWDRG